MSDYGYEVLGNPDEGVVSVLLHLGDLTDSKGEVFAEETESALFYPGNVIPENEIANHIKAKYEDGDEHTLSLFKRVKIDSSNSADEVVDSEPKPKAKTKTSAKKTSDDE